jgi:aryl-alcohol dehydrogenase-like predicted oxidoreductase
MPTRKLGPFDVFSVGLGCMSLSHAYGIPPDAETGAKILNAALDLGYTHLDTASLYGFGANEMLIGNVLKKRRNEFALASKCGMFRNAAGQREINGDPAILRKTCEESLQRLQTDVIDLYYLHRWDKRRPIEESIGTLSDLVREGKIKTIGLSEVGAATIRKAHKVHPLAAVQTEYSLWTRNAETAVLETCKELGITFVAFSPLARGFLSGKLREVGSLPPKDIRLAMPRFQPGHFERNLRLLDGLEEIANAHEATMGQIALAWLLAQGNHIIPIPGTTKLDHLKENADAAHLTLSAETLDKLNALINPTTVSGPRYPASTLPEIDTEEEDLTRYA